MEVNQPAVSIVIPTYNHAGLLKEALQSILAQTFTNWEAIIINNFSEDNTLEVIDSFNDQRLHLFNFRNHGIIAASRNEGIRRARAGIIAFLDSDDVWYPLKLAVCLKAFTPEVDLICHGEVLVVNSKPSKKIVYGPICRAQYHRLLLEGNCLSTSAVLVRKSVLESVGGFSEDPGIVTAEDYDLWLKLSRRKTSFAFINEMLGEYRLHQGNASGNIIRHMQAVINVLERHFSSLEQQDFQSRLKIKRRLALEYYSAAKKLFQADRKEEARKFLRKSFFLFPFLPKAYIIAFLALFSKIKQR